MHSSRPRRTRTSFASSRLAVAGWLCGSILAVVVVAPVSGARPLKDSLLPGLSTASLPLSLPTLPPPLPTPPLPSLPLPSLPLPPLPSLPLPSLPLPSASPSIPALPSISPPTPPPSASVPATPGPSSGSASAAPPLPGSSGSTPAAGGTVDQSPPPGASGSDGQPLPPSPLEQFLVPGLLVAVPAFLLIAIIALQVAGGVVWLPLVRRWVGRPGERRAAHRRQP
jgi:hypothetical protein